MQPRKENGPGREDEPILSRAHIGIGSNMGKSAILCRHAVDLLGAVGSARVVAMSSLYRTEPVGVEAQDWFVNCAVIVETGLSPHRLLEHMQHIENEMGRVRLQRWGPRTIDLDLLFFDDLIIDDPMLKVPHPELHLRGFVLAPLKEIDPLKFHPILKKTVLQLYDELDDTKQVHPLS